MCTTEDYDYSECNFGREAAFYYYKWLQEASTAGTLLIERMPCRQLQHVVVNDTNFHDKTIILASNSARNLLLN